MAAVLYIYKENEKNKTKKTLTYFSFTCLPKVLCLLLVEMKTTWKVISFWSEKSFIASWPTSLISVRKYFRALLWYLDWYIRDGYASYDSFDRADCNPQSLQIIHLRKVLETYERKIGKLEEKVCSKERQLEQNVSDIKKTASTRKFSRNYECGVGHEACH